jgi:hypothetical protein
MILYKTKEEPDTRDCAAFHAHRTVLELYRWGISWACQGKRKSNNEWQSLHFDDTGIEVNSHFSIGFKHVYYDGPHCFFALGFVHIRWNSWDCKKCCPRDFGDK